MRTRNRNRQLHVESLEQRELLSWTPGTIPGQIPAPSAAHQFVMTSNVFPFSGTVAGIQGNPQGSYQQITFVASRTATFTISINDTANSFMAPIFAVWNSSGQEAWYCDQGAKRNISATVPLVQGNRYELGIDNLTGYVGGSFTGTITGSPLSQNVSSNSGNCYTYGSAVLNGNTLTISILAENCSWNTTYTHKVYVYLENAAGYSLAGPWVLTATTYGMMDPNPNSHSSSGTYTYDVSGYNLTGLNHIYICT